MGVKRFIMNWAVNNVEIATFILLIVLLAALAIPIFVPNIVINYRWENEVESYFNLADKASTADLKYKYLLEYAEALKKKGLDKGQARWIFKTPDTDLNRNFEILQTLIRRTEEITKLDPKSLEYQQALKQITDNEFKWFDSCVFVEGWRRQSVIRWLITPFGLSCTNNHESHR